MASAALSNRLVCCQPPNSSSASAPPSTVPTMLISLLPNMPPESALAAPPGHSGGDPVDRADRKRQRSPVQHQDPVGPRPRRGSRPDQLTIGGERAAPRLP